MQTVTLASHAMATRFELVLRGENPAALRAAGEEALREVDRLENQLSLYRPGSEIAQVNFRAAREAVPVSPELFDLLRQAEQLHAETGGAFDITIAPLVRCWGFMGGTGKMPTPEEVADARNKVGMQHVQLDPTNRSVRFAREGMMLDLGAIGKGYAVERAAEILREAGVTSALIHGGTSTVCGIGHPPEAESWKVAVDLAAELERRQPRRPDGIPFSKIARPLIGAPLTITLCDECLSVSAASGRQFEHEGKLYGHVLDPRTGQPVDSAVLSAVALGSATETDALSTALLTLGQDGLDPIAKLRPGLRGLIANWESGALWIDTRGLPEWIPR